MRRFAAAAAISAVLAAALFAGCKAENEITNVPTPKPESQRIVINHELEAPDHVIEVRGYGEVTVTADYATLTLRVSAAAETAEAASLACEEKAKTVRDSAVAQGVPETDIKSDDVEITAQLRASDGATTGYSAAETVILTLRDIALSGAITSSVVDASVAEIVSVTYSVNDASGAYLSALGEAMRNARTKAEAVAGASAVTLGPVIGVVENVGEGKDLIGIAFESSSIAVSADVTVLFEIPQPISGS